MEANCAPPAMADQTAFGLDSPSKNKELLAKLLKKPHSLIARIGLRTGEKLALYKTGEAEGSVFAQYDTHLALYIQFHQYKYAFLPVATVTQTKLWRNKELPVTNNFSQALFFRIMLAQSTAMLSDVEHTPDGIEFWKRRAGEALGKGLNVALVDFGKRSYEQFTSGKELEKTLTASWGGGMDATRYKQMRWLIWQHQ